MVLLAAGHTMGAVIRTPHFNDAASAVRSAMTSVRFPCDGSSCTWFGFYLGFAIMLSVFVLLSAFAVWYVGGLDRATRIRLRPVTFAVLLSFAAMALVSKFFFFAPPLMLSLIITALLTIILAKFP